MHAVCGMSCIAFDHACFINTSPGLVMTMVKIDHHHDVPRRQVRYMPPSFTKKNIVPSRLYGRRPCTVDWCCIVQQLVV